MKAPFAGWRIAAGPLTSQRHPDDLTWSKVVVGNAGWRHEKPLSGPNADVPRHAVVDTQRIKSPRSGDQRFSLFQITESRHWSSAGQDPARHGVEPREHRWVTGVRRSDKSRIQFGVTASITRPPPRRQPWRGFLHQRATQIGV